MISAKTEGSIFPVMLSRLLKDRSGRINLTLIGTSVLLLILFGAMLPNFITAGNFINMGHQMAITAIIAFAMTAVILAKGIDLSVGSSLALAGIVGGLAFQSGVPPLLVLLLTLVVGVAVGVLNGFLVTVLKISPFIATFGTMAMCRGAALSLSNASSIQINDPALIWLGSYRIGLVPLSIILVAILLVAWWVLFNRTILGRYIYAVGGNEEATRASALKGKSIQFLTYVMAGGFSGLASILLIGRVQSAQPLGGFGLEFDVITAVVIGGTLLMGGVGSVLGTFFGAILVTIIRTGLSFFGIAQEITYIVTGAMILLSVLLYQPDLLKSLKYSGGRTPKIRKVEFSETAGTTRREDHSLRLQNIGKLYSGVRALNQVSFEISSGEVVALVGENGAGKSTLVKIMSGVITPEEGSIELDGKNIELTNPKAARDAGIGVIHQHYSLVPELTIYENLFIGREETVPGSGLLRRKRMKKLAGEWLDQFGIHLNPETKIGKLTVGQCQLIEVVKATMGNPWMIIMDEPTSSLSKSESEKLYDLIGQLTRRNVGILYISHKMEEIYRFCTRAVVLRDGTHVGNAALPQTEESNLINMMVGRNIESVFPYNEANPGKLALEVSRLSDGGLLQDASFQVREGEVVVLAGLIGSGRSEVLEAIFGLSKIKRGSLSVFGKLLSRPVPRKMSDMGVAFVPEDRHKAGFVPMLSIRHNLSLSWLRRNHKLGFISMKEERNLASTMIKKLNIRPPDPDKQTIHLSGGNQQKVVLGKWLVTQPKLLLLDDPTRGVDVGAKSEIHQWIAELKAQGAAILIVSSELPEALNVADRIVVMHAGRTVAELQHGATENEVMNYALGVARKA